MMMIMIVEWIKKKECQYIQMDGMVMVVWCVGGVAVPFPCCMDR